jgi:hypothetical protein
MTETHTYHCTFDRIGRAHDVPPADFVARDLAELPHAMYSFVRRFCASNEVEVRTYDNPPSGEIIVGGFRPAGTFTITEVPS